MFLSLLYLIVLATIAYQSKRIVLSALIFGALKAISSTFHYRVETDLSEAAILALGVGQFAVNALLGYCIAYLVVKRAQEAKYMAMTTALAIFTFLTTMIDLGLVARA